jgi:hypothetical protein
LIGRRLIGRRREIEMHALVVGGTGMLSGLTQHLLSEAETVSLVARRPERLRAPTDRERLNPIALDYRQTDRLAAAIREAIAAHGPIQLAVCWIHRSALDALPTLLTELAHPGLPFRLFHVRGSAAADPSALPNPVLDRLPEVCQYRQVILGFVLEGDRSRWLTNVEISAGVIQAVASDSQTYIVGTVRPWSRRPGW